MLLMAQTELTNSKETMWFLDSGCSNHMTGDRQWFLDSGCSNHMTGDRQWFIHLDESFRQVVKLGNDTKMDVMGKGNIKLRINGTS
jgi:hypothetical protein